MKLSPELRPTAWDALVVLCAALLTLGSAAPLYYLPVLLAVSLLTGGLTDLASACLFQGLRHTDLMKG